MRGPPPTLPGEALGLLDDAFHFTSTGNAEVLAAWLGRATAVGDEPAAPALENFLRRVRRRKFVVPLYRALLATLGGTACARDIYAAARPNYYAVTTSTLDALLPPRGFQSCGSHAPAASMAGLLAMRAALASGSVSRAN